MDPRTNLRILKPFLISVQQAFGPARVILFGSRARGDAGPRSDYDLLVISTAFEPIKFYDRQVQMFKLLPRDIDVDVICLTPEEFKRRSRSLSIIGEAAREGVEISA